MTHTDEPRGRGLKIATPDPEGRGAVSRAHEISKRRPPLGEALPSDSRDLDHVPPSHGAPTDLEGVLDWARRAGEDRTEVPALLDDLQPAEVRALAARLVQVVGLLELCPPGVEPAYFIARVEALSGDFAQDPWTNAEADR